MTAHLMLAYALLLAGIAGSTGHGWAFVVVIPHLAAWAWLRGETQA